MTGEVRIQLLGPPRIELNANVANLGTRKSLALLAYLATTGEEHSREELATLFWPESGQRRGRDSLRQALVQIRKHLGQEALFADNDRVGLQWDSAVWVDVHEYQAMLSESCTAGHRRNLVCSVCAPCLQDAVALYRGDFLKGLSLRDCAVFDEWMFFQTEQYRQALAEALQKLISYHSGQQRYLPAIDYARRWLALDTLEEAAHRSLIRLYAQAGQPSAALRQYQICREYLERELTIEPDAETQALYAKVQGGALAPELAAPAHTRQRHNLPSPLKPFVGRERELDQISVTLTDPASRMLTIIGAGGMGKTALALQVARQMLGHYSYDVYFVSLTEVGSPDLIALTTLDAMGVRPKGNEPAEAQLITTLGDKQCLLILDNFEHLLAGTALLETILQAAPGIQLLVTSRERLMLPGEQLLPLRGLETPALDSGGAPGNGEEASGNLPARWLPQNELEQSSALFLFRQGVERLQPQFQWRTTDVDAAVRICQLVEGMPLAIELAAAWTLIAPVRTIAQEIARSLDYVAAPSAARDDRHSSVRAVFNQTWRLLSAPERAVASRLAVFRGGFRYEAAHEVAGASLAHLATLVNKSWVHLGSNERYAMHRLLRQFLAEKLEEATDRTHVDSVLTRHSLYYANFLSLREARHRGPNTAGVLHEIMAEFDNIRAAWEWTVQQQDVNTLDKFVNSLSFVAESRGRIAEVNEMLDAAYQNLRAKRQSAEASSSAAHIVMGHLACVQAYLSNYQGQFERMRSLCEEGLNWLKCAQPGRQRDLMIAEAQVQLGLALKRLDQRDLASHQLQEALRFYTAIGDRNGEWRSLFFLAQINREQNRLDELEELWQRIEALLVEMDNPSSRAHSLQHVGGDLAYLQGDVACAERRFREALEIGRQLENSEIIAGSAHVLGRVYLAQGRYQAARQTSLESLTIAGRIGSKPAIANSLNVLGNVALALGETDEAMRCFKQSHDVSQEIGLVPPLCESVIGLGKLACRRGDFPLARTLVTQGLAGNLWGDRLVDGLVAMAYVFDHEQAHIRALELLHFVLQQPYARQDTKERALPLLIHLQSALDPELDTAAAERASKSVLNDVVASCLQVQPS